MTREFEWAVYDKRQLHLNKQQLLAIGDRSYPVREKRLELQHPNVAFFNVAFRESPAKGELIARLALRDGPAQRGASRTRLSPDGAHNSREKTVRPDSEYSTATWTRSFSSISPV